MARDAMRVGRVLGARAIERRLVADRRAALAEAAEQLRRRETDVAALQVPLVLAKEERPAEKSIVMERETPLPLSSEAQAGSADAPEKPTARKRRQRAVPAKPREGPVRPRPRRKKNDDEELGPRS